ncbi:Rieske (2Fe-2S) protein [Streptomyces sp. KLOTTS4A1]|uniref:Rieske (2Fe-2S) protein n=1 Tax=Streptomyces sp. KLOTTS4A1 TaxID=3390996 RepID=UPI0039F61573
MTVTQEPRDLVEPTEPEAPGRGCGCPSRRAVVSAAGAAGLAVALTACGGSDSGGDGGAYSSQTDGPTGTTSGEPTDEASEQPTESGAGGGEEIARTSEIPEGGGAVFKDEGVVVVQPTAGDFKAYTSTCTHQGCTVRDVADGTINCPCHGSKFSIEDGSVKGGPAQRPLPAKEITVEGESIRLA